MTSAKVDTSHYESTVNAATFSTSVYESSKDDASSITTFQATTTTQRNILILKNFIRFNNLYL